MSVICLHDKDEIAAFLRRDPLLHIYALGDLDDFFWPYTTWYGLRAPDGVAQIALLYSGADLPVLLALTGAPAEPMRELLRALGPVLPRRFYAHFSGGLAAAFASDYRMQSHGAHDKMALADPARLRAVDVSDTVALTPDDLGAIEDLYRASYPGNWFDPRMLETGHYYGVRDGAALVSVAGVHVYSPRYGVAALGNITTRPDLRGSGLATSATARLCLELLRTVEHIGLNVKSDNRAAIACYEKLGFERIGAYEEWMLES